MIRVVRAAGTLPWRKRRGQLEVAVVHRPRYDDWSWAKGKLDPGEDFPVAAARETSEETGLTVRLGRPLPTATYPVADRGGAALKEVRYWAAEVVGGTGVLENEIDEVVWLDTAAARERLHYERDEDQLGALVAADAAGALTTWPLLLIRHAHAEPRSSWDGPDPLRPLDLDGTQRAKELVPLLAAYGISRVVSSPSVRCADTVAPYAAWADLPLRLKAGLSEEGFAENPGSALHRQWRLLERGSAAALCSHGDVLPSLVKELTRIVDVTSATGVEAIDALEQCASEGIEKGEVLVCHLVGTGELARVVAVERYR